MSRLARRRVRAFTIGFEGRLPRRTAGARGVAERFSTVIPNSRHQAIGGADRSARLAYTVRSRLVGDSNVSPLGLTRQHVVVVLTGDGGDELCSPAIQVSRRTRGRAHAEGAVAVLTAALRCCLRRTLAHVLAREPAVRSVRFSLVERAARWNSLFPDELRRCSIPMCLRQPTSDPMSHFGPSVGAYGAFSFDMLSRQTSRRICPTDLLVKTDRCTRRIRSRHAPRCSIRRYRVSRVPPDGFKLAGAAPRSILRGLVRRHDSRLHRRRRPKTGSACPLPLVPHDLRDFVRDTLLGPSAHREDTLRPGSSGAARRRPPAGRTNAGSGVVSGVFQSGWLHLLPAGAPPR